MARDKTRQGSVGLVTSDSQIGNVSRVVLIDFDVPKRSVEVSTPSCQISLTPEEESECLQLFQYRIFGRTKSTVRFLKKNSNL